MKSRKLISLLVAVVQLFVILFPVTTFADNTISSSSIEKAINYAYNEKSTRPDYWKGYCAAFVWACYNKGAGLSNRSYPTAREMGDALITHTDANPPRGAFVFWYKTSDPYNHAGHVGLSLGDGTVIHAFSSIKVSQISTVNNSGYTYRGWGAPISGYTLDTQSAPAELTVSGAVYPSGHYDSLPNFGLRGMLTSGSTITRVEAHVYDSNGVDAITPYSKTWNSSNYNIQTDGINNHFSFGTLGNGTYRYVVLARDSSMNNFKELIDSTFTIGSSSSSDYQNTWTNTGNMAVDIAEVAYTQVGYHETGTNHTKYNQWYYGNDTAAAWCATFVSWCANQAGIPQSIIKRSAYAYPGSDDFNIPYYSFGSVEPEKGDLIFVENNGNLNYGNVYGFDHVGIVYAVDDSFVYTVEGNDGNYVTYNMYSKSNGYDTEKASAYIAWIGKPNYTGSQPVVIPTGTISEKLASILADYPDGSSWTETFDGAKKSYGFAGLVIYKIFGNSTVSGKTYRWWLYSGVSESGIQAVGSVDTCTEVSVRDLLLQARPGDVLQFDKGPDSGTQFSMIVYSLTTTGAYIYDCNLNGDSVVRLHHMSYSDFIQLQGVGPKGKLTLLRSDNYDSIEPPMQKSVLDLNGYLDSKLIWGNIDGYGTADVYINGVIAAIGVSDYCTELPVGTAYEIRNIQAIEGHVYSGLYSGSLSGIIGSERVEVLLSFNSLVYLNLDGNLAGDPTCSSIGGYGTVDVYINGNLDASGVSDYFVQWPVGTTYEIKNIKALDGCRYDGVYSGSLSGTIGAEQVDVVLSFSSLTYLNLDGLLDGTPNDGLAQYGVADVYINGVQIADGWSDYFEAWAPGTTYEIKNIRANDGYRYDGVYSGSLTGTLSTERVNVVLQFSTVQAYTIAYNANGGTNAPASQAKTPGEELTLASTIPTRTDWYFLGWTESADAGTAAYLPGGSFTKDADTTLYAVWAQPDFVLPTALTTIENEAFANCAFRFAALSENTDTIGKNAFANCPNLKYIYIPEDCLWIDRYAFTSVTGLTILGVDGSYAKTYAKQVGFTFIPIA